MRMCLAVASLLVAAGCAAPEDPTLFGPRLPPSACIRPIEEFCTPRPCETYDERVRLIESRTAPPCSASVGRLRIGTCGDLRFISEGHAFGGETRYFDASGRVVAAERGDDVVAWSGCDDGPFGFIPGCEHKVTRDLCRP